MLDHSDLARMPRHRRGKRRRSAQKSPRESLSYILKEDETEQRKRELIDEALTFEHLVPIANEEELKLLALQDGGLLDIEFRRIAWKRILKVPATASKSMVESVSLSVELVRQIDLDVARSYGDQKYLAREKRIRLRALLVSFFERNGDLCYYQGFHDVVSVVAEVYHSDLDVHAICEVLSRLFIFRDAHFRNFQKVEELLRLVLVLIDISDEDIANVLRGSPFWGLSMLITCFAHNLPSSSVRLRIFDAMLASHPTLPIYLVAAFPSMPFVRERLRLAEDSGYAHGIVLGAVKEIRSVNLADELVRSARELMFRYPPEELIKLADERELEVRGTQVFGHFPLDTSWVPPCKLTRSAVLKRTLQRRFAALKSRRHLLLLGSMVILWLAISLNFK